MTVTSADPIRSPSITLPAGGHRVSAVPYAISVGTVIRGTSAGNASTASAISAAVRAGSLPWCTSGSAL